MLCLYLTVTSPYNKNLSANSIQRHMVTVFHWSSDSDKREKWQTKHAKKIMTQLQLLRKTELRNICKQVLWPFRNKAFLPWSSLQLSGLARRGVQENKNMKIEKTTILRAILTIGYSDVNPCKDFKKKLKTRRPLRATNVCLCITAEKVMTCLLWQRGRWLALFV